MRCKKHKWIASALAAACIAAHALAVAPHHHHGESNAPCLNIAHCIEQTQEDTGEPCGGGHGHDHCLPEQLPDTEHGCHAGIDIAEVVNGHSYRAVISEISILNDFFAPVAVILPEQANILHSFTLTRRRQQPAPVCRCIVFITEAHSARAPSHSV